MDIKKSLVNDVANVIDITLPVAITSANVLAELARSI
jgi:hypothetical protein